MNRILSILMCACLVLVSKAGEPQLSRSQLKHASITKEQISMPVTATGQEKSISLQQVLKERHLTLNDNKLRSQTSQRQTTDNIQGHRIASMDIYDFNWDNNNSIAVVIDSSCAMAGKACYISYVDDHCVLSNFFDTFSIPLTIDGPSGLLKMRAGVLLDQRTVTEEANPNQPYNLNAGSGSTQYKITKWSLYAMPLSWLAGGETYDDIPCQLNEDGSLEFKEAFGFLVKKSVSVEGSSVSTTWGLSPIYDNVVLLTPNGGHQFSYFTYYSSLDTLTEPIQDGMGNGGLAPRPIATGPKSTKPVRPRQFEAAIGRGFNAGNGTESGKLLRPSSKADRKDGDLDYKTYTSPVYLYMLDDTTLMVYNLYDEDYCWHYMYLYPDGTVRFPKQDMGSKSDITYCNASEFNRGFRWGNYGTWNEDSITWNTTYIMNETGSLLSSPYFNNKLYFGYNSSTEWQHPAPVFSQPIVTDTAVIFSVSSIDPNGIAYLYLYIEEEDTYYNVDNPWYAPRNSEPYTVYLAAESFYEATDEFSEPAFFEYEVPALDSNYIRGDVNNDGNLSINDVTALINALLTSDFNDSDSFCHRNADCDLDGTIKINDVTTLIGFLLSGHWPESNN